MRQIFVFGSNLAGKHYGGSASHAVTSHGAEIGNGVGMQGDSYAIPTLDGEFRKLPLKVIAEHVGAFLWFAAMHPEWTFNVVAIGCGIAGFSPTEIAPMFKDATSNVILPAEFTKEQAA